MRSSRARVVRQFASVPAAAPTRPVPCPIALSVGDTAASGEWRDGKNVLPIALQQGRTLVDTGPDAPRVARVVEVPMWHRTKSHMLLGVYRSSAECTLSMVGLRLVNIKNGQVDKELKFGCDAGTAATPIFANVYRAGNPRHVTMLCQGGYRGMGDDRDVAAEP